MKQGAEKTDESAAAAATSDTETGTKEEQDAVVTQEDQALNKVATLYDIFQHMVGPQD